MASVKAFLRSEKKKCDAKLLFRLRDGREVDLSCKSNIKINPEYWDSTKECIKRRKISNPLDIDINEIEAEIRDYKNLILKAYKFMIEEEQEISSSNLKLYIDKFENPEKYERKLKKSETFFDYFNYYIDTHTTCENNIKHLQVIKRALMRFEEYKQLSTNTKYKIEIDKVNDDTLREIESFLYDEPSIFQQHPELYKNQEETRTPKQRGQNTLIGIMRKIGFFFNWANTKGITSNQPFKNYKVGTPIYGTPFYITIEERNQLYAYNFANRNSLEIQRDIFIFHCLIGCRVGDLIKLKKSNVIGISIEYIAGKTLNGSPKTIKIPLNKTALEILKKYKKHKGDSLLPFISTQKYNIAIKEMFKVAGLDRKVTILNPTTRIQEHKSLYEVASSHMARRTFIGNLYKKVQDPNLIGALSGHSENSRAFTRYREIDMDIKSELVKLIE